MGWDMSKRSAENASGRCRAVSGRDRLWRAAPLILALLLLLAINVRGYFRPVPHGARKYRAHVMAIAASLPHHFGNWHGRDVPLPRSAVSLLQPTVDFCREFTNNRTGQAATLMIIDCSDTRNLTGHYPPNCYPGNGWILEKCQDVQANCGADSRCSAGQFSLPSQVTAEQAAVHARGKTYQPKRG